MMHAGCVVLVPGMMMVVMMVMMVMHAGCVVLVPGMVMIVMMVMALFS